MKQNRKNVTLSLAVVGLTLLVGMTSCKGRTMENMEPTGDTVEVVIDGDTASAPLDTVSEVL